jgi:hypothetical protein
MSVRISLLSAWNGPFALGPLTKPVMAGDAVMKVLEVAWKAGCLALMGFLGFIIAMMIWIPIGISTGILR